MKVFVKEFFLWFQACYFLEQTVIPASICSQDYKTHARIAYEKARSRYRDLGVFCSGSKRYSVIKDHPISSRTAQNYFLLVSGPL